MANLQRLLHGWGWVVEDEVVNNLKSKLTANVDPKRFALEDGVIGKIVNG